MEFDKEFLDKLFEQAMENPRLRQNFDLRTSSADTSQRMLNALLQRTEVPIHRHEKTAETVICLVGKLEEVFYEEVDEYVHETTSCCDDVVRQRSFKEISRQVLSPVDGKFGIQIPAGAWHTINVIEPSVIFETKDGAYNRLGKHNS